MKKTKLFSALILVLMLLLAFSSCGATAFLGNLNFDYKSEPVYSGAVEVTNLYGTVSDYGNTLVYTYGTSSDGNGSVYSLYNIDTGNVMFTDTITNIDAANGKYENIKIYEFGKQDIYTIERGNNYMFESISLYDQNGTCIATSSVQTTPSILGNELLVFNNTVYTLGKNGFEKYAELDGNLRALPTEDDADKIILSKKYVYAIDDAEITVYTKKGEFVYGYTAPSYAESTAFFVLDNGKIVVQYLKELTEPSEKYDIVIEGNKFDLVTRIIDPANGKIKNKSLDFMLLIVMSSYEATYTDEDIFKDGFNGNIAYIMPIENDGSVNTNIFKIVELYDDLKIRSEFSDILGYESSIDEFRIVRDGVMVVEDDYDNLVFIKKNGKIVATLRDNDVEYSENFIVTETAIYDYGMKVLLELEKNEYELVELTDTFVILKKDNEYYRYTAGMTTLAKIDVLVTGDQYEGVYLGMCCVRRGSEYAYLDATGRTIATFSGKISASYVSESGNALVRAGGKFYKLTF